MNLWRVKTETEILIAAETAAEAHIAAELLINVPTKVVSVTRVELEGKE